MRSIGIITNNINDMSLPIERVQESIRDYSFCIYNLTYLRDENEFDDDLLIIDSNHLDRYTARNCRKTKVATCIYDNTDEKLVNLLGLNLYGYFHPDMDQEEIANAIQMILNGRIYVHPKFSTIFLKTYRKCMEGSVKRPKGILTEREWAVLKQMAMGNNNIEISKQLFISENTVKNHISSIIRKLNVDNRTNAVLLAIKNKWIII